MKLLFWFSLFLVGYTYVGYALLLAVYAKLHRMPTIRESIAPAVSIVIAVHNEEHWLPRKLDNLAGLNYPQEKLQIVIVSDGSTDRTAKILAARGKEVTSLLLDRAHGKAAALNEAVKLATGEILVMLDIRQVVDENAIRELISCFADLTVGAVSGELLLTSADDESSNEGLGIYWKIEKALRKLESQSGSVVGVTGAIYAMRRELYQPIPAGVILDDVFVPMNIARQNKRILFHAPAIARDRIFTEKGKEFSRKVRTLTGNYQLLRIAPWLLSRKNPLLFRFISHKLLRLVVPFCLIVILITSGLTSGYLYRAIFLLQLIFYGLAILGSAIPTVRKWKPIGIAYTFASLNFAALIAFRNFITQRHDIWR